MRAASGGPVRPALLLIFILLVAANLRAVLAAVGPVLPDIASDLDLSPTEQGILTAVPLAMFALCSPLVHPVAARFGRERTLLGTLLLLGVGVVLRSVPLWGDVPLWAGTAAIGVAVAAANVLLPVLVRGGFDERGAVVSGQYVAVQIVVAATASMLVVPLMVMTGSWRLAVAVWGVLVLAALCAWRPRLIRPTGFGADGEWLPEPSVRVWRSPLAWQVAGYFGLQSACFYVLMYWLPSVEQDMGVGAATAGAHLAVLLVTGVAATLVVPPLLANRRDHRLVAAAAPVILLVAISGLAVAPSLAVVWAGIAGFALSASLVISLALINDRTSRSHVTSRLSSMVQGTAYTGVVLLLIAAGLVREFVGPGSHVLGLVALASVATILLAPWVGRDRTLDAAVTRS
ncbi:MFS transporter [Nitriliruptor alkaliphilus]|uniref:MFS transporter n=1 Tax=Nitriliruptor alkaliphilus TaxID=427918 RepID=UPI00069616B6|nr:MFS transporter [Nitriliruptor alkaliphilus]